MMKKVIALSICICVLTSTTGCKESKIYVDVSSEIKLQKTREEVASATETVIEHEVLNEQELIESEKENPSDKNEESTLSESENTVPTQNNQENNEKRELKFLDTKTNAEIEIVPIPPQVDNATAEDGSKIADKILEYINSDRKVSAVKLEGLTEYAKCRSQQLISRFAHNTEDERAAATALKYGEYVEPSLYGMTGEPYYTSCSREAIAKAGYAGTVDELAQRFANLIKNSAKHWCYVGADEYLYIGVGVTYESGMWYCDVAVAKENTDEK